MSFLSTDLYLKALLSQTSHTAILVFAHSSDEEMRHKHIYKGKLLFDHLNTSTERKVRKTGIPYFVYTEKEQTGTSFGARLTHAIQDVFSLGYNQIITVGNDTPQLQTQDIDKAVRLLEQYDTVIGPSIDGGTYLIGLKKESFDPKNFQSLPWQTEGLRKSLLETINQQGLSEITLQFLHDIDSYSDLRHFSTYAFTLESEFRAILEKLLSSSRYGVAHHFIGISTYFVNEFYNKGSPNLTVIS